MYRHVIVPLDGSDGAEQALAPALAITRASGGTLRLVRVRESVPAYQLASAVVQTDRGPALEAVTGDGFDSDGRAYLSDIAARLRREGAGNVAIDVLDGPVVAALCAAARELAASLIILATHGRGRSRRMWLGSVAHGVTRHASVPVLLVRPREQATAAGADRLFRNVLLPLDGSAAAATIVPHAVALGALAGARYTLLHVLPPAGLPAYALPDEGIPMDWSQLEEHAAQRVLEYQAGAMRLQSLRVQQCVVRAGSTADAILTSAAKCGADLIALAAHGHWLGHLILGDVADEVIRRSPVPVLHFHPPER